MIKRVLVGIFVVVVLVISLLGCGGGFEHDSENANNLGKSIFGPDSISEDTDSDTIQSSRLSL